MPIHSEFLLNDGQHIPVIGFGTWPLTDDEATVAVNTALDTGYRLIDTAARYNNETGVGRAIRESGVARDSIFLTSKLAGTHHRYEQALEAFDISLSKLGVDVLDLYLIHWPLPQQDLYVEAWQALIALREQGRVKSIGVSNFQPAHIERLIQETGVVPAVNQIEIHPDFAQHDLRAFHKTRGIVTQSWSPIGRGKLLHDTRIVAIAQKYDRTAAQIMLRWHIESGLLPIPKSSSPQRIKENLDVFSFAFDTEDLATLRTLDGDHRQGGHPDTHTE